MGHNFEQDKKNKKEIAVELVILFSFYITYILFDLHYEVAPNPSLTTKVKNINFGRHWALVMCILYIIYSKLCVSTFG